MKALAGTNSLLKIVAPLAWCACALAIGATAMSAQTAGTTRSGWISSGRQPIGAEPMDKQIDAARSSFGGRPSAPTLRSW